MSAIINGWRCNGCGTITAEADILTAPHPFDPEYEVRGCPVCLEIEQFTYPCVICGREATIGFPTPDGYRWACGSAHAVELGWQKL